jgi:hypothetical protein
MTGYSRLRHGSERSARPVRPDRKQAAFKPPVKS